MRVNKILAKAKYKMFFKTGIFMVILMITMISCSKYASEISGTYSGIISNYWLGTSEEYTLTLKKSGTYTIKVSGDVFYSGKYEAEKEKDDVYFWILLYDNNFDGNRNIGYCYFDNESDVNKSLFLCIYKGYYYGSSGTLYKK